MKEIRRGKSISQALAKEFGGKWTYDDQADWWCDDDVRHVGRRSACLCDDYCDHPPSYYLYGDGTPERILIY